MVDALNSIPLINSATVDLVIHKKQLELSTIKTPDCTTEQTIHFFLYNISYNHTRVVYSKNIARYVQPSLIICIIFWYSSLFICMIAIPNAAVIGSCSVFLVLPLPYLIYKIYLMTHTAKLSMISALNQLKAECTESFT